MFVDLLKVVWRVRWLVCVLFCALFVIDLLLGGLRFMLFEGGMFVAGLLIGRYHRKA